MNRRRIADTASSPAYRIAWATAVGGSLSVRRRALRSAETNASVMTVSRILASSSADRGGSTLMDALLALRRALPQRGMLRLDSATLHEPGKTIKPRGVVDQLVHRYLSAGFQLDPLGQFHGRLLRAVGHHAQVLHGGPAPASEGNAGGFVAKMPEKGFKVHGAEDTKRVALWEVPFGVLPIGSHLPSTDRMDDEDVRRTRHSRLMQLYKERFEENAAALARALGKEPAFIRFRLQPEKPGGRWIGEKLAREIEQKLELPDRWMDGVDGPTSGASFLEQLIDLQQRYPSLNEAERSMVDTYLKHHGSLGPAFGAPGDKPKP
jgi:hypothetical protein